MKTEIKKRLLCITPDLRQTGAPIALLGLLRILQKKDTYDIYVLTYGKGVLLSSFEELIGKDHIEILDGLNPTMEFRNHIMNDYDIVILNTAAVYTFMFYFQNTGIPVYWWIHEAPEMIEDSFPGFPNPHLISPNFRLFVPSGATAISFREHYTYDTTVLPIPVFEKTHVLPKIPFPLPDDRVLFIIPSAYSYIKGQDILLSAIISLPDEYRKRSYFIFCGYTIDKQEEYKRAVFEAASNIDNVLMLEDQPQDLIYSLIRRSDCIIAPSRIDCLPTTIAEGMMLKTLCLVSDKTGISHYITDCQNGFVFGSSDELLKRLLLIISDTDSLSDISERGHLLYNDHFSPEAIEVVLNNIGL